MVRCQASPVPPPVAAECADRGLREAVFPLWFALDRAQGAPAAAAEAPWASGRPAVQAAWAALTAPGHLPALEAWSRVPDMAAPAREWTRRALDHCRARAR